MNRTSIGKRIRACREEKGWSQEVFAEKIGLNIAYTGMIERGEKVPKLETFVRIANALEVSADHLLADVLRTQLAKSIRYDKKRLSEDSRDYMRTYASPNSTACFLRKNL